MRGWSASSFPPPRAELLAPHARPAQWFGVVARRPVCLNRYGITRLHYNQCFYLQISIFGGVNFFHTTEARVGLTPISGIHGPVPPWDSSTLRISNTSLIGGLASQ